jgi:hypothetical protein
MIAPPDARPFHRGGTEARDGQDMHHGAAEQGMGWAFTAERPSKGGHGVHRGATEQGMGGVHHGDGGRQRTRRAPQSRGAGEWTGRFLRSPEHLKNPKNLKDLKNPEHPGTLRTRVPNAPAYPAYPEVPAAPGRSL